MKTFESNARLRKLAIRFTLAVIGCIPVGWAYAEVCRYERECTITTTKATYSDGTVVILSEDVECSPWDRTCRESTGGSSGSGSGGGSTGGGSAGSSGGGGDPGPTCETGESAETEEYMFYSTEANMCPVPKPPVNEKEKRIQRCLDCRQDLCMQKTSEGLEVCKVAVVRDAMAQCTLGFLPNGHTTQKGYSYKKCGEQYCAEWFAYESVPGVPVLQCKRYVQTDSTICETLYEPKDQRCVSYHAYGMPGETTNSVAYGSIGGEAGLAKWLAVNGSVQWGGEKGWSYNANDGKMKMCGDKMSEHQAWCQTTYCKVECDGLDIR